LKARLIREARVRLEKSGQNQPGGQSITFAGEDGGVARINIPLPSLKSKIAAEGRPLSQIKIAAGPHFDDLFVPSLAYAPIEGFRSEAAGFLGIGALRLIRLCETDAYPRVYFETKDSPKKGLRES
jgi:hypothetical protein